eukprot:TRINITY_DN7249_c0_g1_i1.p1 TRINITY_DN7249_c0_g1~~TRINITY_DN7249_c0_g1_i1.p1  ORF type:complete len:229 (+),score=50.96 TRINITY_DN7249_c0_g1_i1:242-928(+)
MAQSDSAAQTVKIVLVGDGTSGKTSLICRYCQGQFESGYNQTMGLDFFMKRLLLPNDQHVTLQIWDIGGQAIGGKMIKTYLESAQAVLFVFDITNRDSFENLEDWVELVKLHFKGKIMPKLGLVAAKQDLGHQRAVSPSKQEEFAKRHGLVTHDVCAKDNSGVEMCFRRTVAAVTGIQITKAEVEAVRNKPVIAGIVNHPKVEAVVPATTHSAGASSSAKSSSFCAVQ